MKTIFHDPFFTSSITENKDQFEISYPLADENIINEVANQIRNNADKYFGSHSSDEIQFISDIIDSSFFDPSGPENVELVNNIRKTSGFSKFDIEHWGLGLFSCLKGSDSVKNGYYVNKAFTKKGIIPTSSGYLKRIGFVNPFNRWKEPKLVSHFVSGNVVGYTAILSKIGMPVKKNGAAQILKLPSTASFFPMVYLNKLEAIAPDLRNTIACGYWKGGDNGIERKIIEESDAINILSSDHVINDLKHRIGKYHRGITTLTHGHKIGIAYVSKEFLNDEELLEPTLNGLVTDISAFDGGACYNVKNVFVQGDPWKFAEKLFLKLELFEREISPVSENAKSTGLSLHQIYKGSSEVISSDDKCVFVRVKKTPEFWKPDELFRYVQVMEVKDEQEVFNLISRERHYLQTAVIALPDEKIIPIFCLFAQAGISNVHYPGSAPLLNAYEEPHDGEFDFIRLRYNYSARFAATNFKINKDWIRIDSKN